MNCIYSIGHSNKTVEELIRELRLYGINYLIDVRSMPYSKYQPQFNREQFQAAINKTGDITYVYMGDVIGGLPANSACYTDGKVGYGKIRAMEFFQKGLERLINANNKNIKVCLMCSEGDPHMCHRSKLIGEALLEHDIIVQHICADHSGNITLKSQIDVINELNNGNNVLDLFGGLETFTSRNRYK